MERPQRIAVPDLISPSYFPAIAAVELGCIADEGVAAEIELLFPVVDAAAALRDGRIDFLAGAAHAPLVAFPEWDGAKLLMALSRNTYWFLVVRRDLDTGAAGLRGLRDVKLGAAPGPDLALVNLFEEASVDSGRNGIAIGPVPAVGAASVSFGVMAARALASGQIDGFWANGMGAELAVREGTGKVLLDARRDADPPRVSSYTFPALITTERMLAEEPAKVDAVVRGVRIAQRRLRGAPELATAVGERVFPPLEASMIAELVERDAPYYEPDITPEMVDGLSSFALDAGLLQERPGYERVVAVRHD
jgi:ABC-type nitrate/sulfonate/bicarbonate transport system substrate-binding protein